MVPQLPLSYTLSSTIGEVTANCEVSRSVLYVSYGQLVSQLSTLEAFLVTSALFLQLQACTCHRNGVYTS